MTHPFQKRPSHLPALSRDKVVPELVKDYIRLWQRGSRNMVGRYETVWHLSYPAYPLCAAYSQWIGQAGRAFEIATRADFNELFPELKSENWQSHLVKEEVA